MSSNYLKKLALAALIAAGTVAGVSAQTTLASWTFDGGYDKAAADGKFTLPTEMPGLPSATTGSKTKSQSCVLTKP